MRPRRLGARALAAVLGAEEPNLTAIDEDGPAAVGSDGSAEVQALFREVNERVREVSAGSSAVTEFICECDDDLCFVPLELTLSEYDAVRGSPIRFLVAAGHLGAHDDAVARGARYWVVEKASGPSAEAALRRDGRFADE